MSRRPTLAVLVAALALLGAGPAAAMSATSPASAGAASHPNQSAERGTPGHWTKISTVTVGPEDHASLLRVGTALQVVYGKHVGDDSQIGHTAISASGVTTDQNDILASPWVTVDDSPILLHTPTGLRVVFGGNQSATESTYWSQGRMYTATAPTTAGSSWTLPMEAVGESGYAFDSYGTAATTLADGTPVAAFPLNGDITWHVGTSDDPNQSYHAPDGSLYSATMVRSGSDVWLGWYANGSTAATNGTFVKQIYPTVGATTKVPGSSVGAHSLATGRVAMVARAGGGVDVAFSAGYPSSTGVRLWKVGTSSTTAVPSSKDNKYLALGAGPSGRIWVTWSDTGSIVHAVRTDKKGFSVGPVRSVGKPPGTGVSNLAIDGSLGVGDIVVNTGSAFWHTQVVPGLTIRAAPSSWHQGTAKTVTFTIADAGDPVPGAKVEVGGRACKTDGSGTCEIHFPDTLKSGHLVAKVAAAGYAPTKVKLKVH